MYVKRKELSLSAWGAGEDTGSHAFAAGRDSVEPKLDFLGKNHGSTEPRPAVHDREAERTEPDADKTNRFEQEQTETDAPFH